MPNGIEQALAVKIASYVTGVRGSFEQIYDAQLVKREGLRPKRPYKIIALPHGGDDAASYQAAIAELPDIPALRSFVMLCVETGVMDARAMLAVPQPAAAARIVTAQAFTEPQLGLMVASSVMRGLMASMYRVAQIQVIAGGATISRGSGFLVGPQTVLTNWHVVHMLIGDAGDALAGSGAQLLVKFDQYGTDAELGIRSQFKGAQDWLVDWRPGFDQEKPDAAVGQVIPARYLAADERLDFALIRLDGSPGRERGWMKLARAARPRTAEMQRVFFALHHPGQMDQMMSHSNGLGYDSDFGEMRFTHSANTEKGSSGALLLNEGAELVGLHNAGAKRPGGEVYNLAIPAFRIGALCGSKAESFDQLLDPVWRLGDKITPVVGREELRTDLAQLWATSTDKPFLAIRHSAPKIRRIGKSFSIAILQTLLPRSDHRIISLSAAEIGTEPRDLAQLTLQRADVKPQLIDQLPKFDNATTTMDGWLRNDLFPAWSELLNQSRGNSTIWIVIDELEHHDVTPSNARRFLELIYSRTPHLGYLRFVLICIDTLPAGIDPARAVMHRLDPPKPADARSYVLRLNEAMTAGLSPEVCKKLGDLAFRISDQRAADGQSNQIEALARIFLDPLQRVLSPEGGNG
jgi:V8-like Glu-specific endopeptidase